MELILEMNKNIRDGILFFAGLGLTIHEALFVTKARPEYLVLYGAMMGLPAYFFSARNGNGKGK